MIDLLVLVVFGAAAVLGWMRGFAVSLLAAVAFLVAGIPAAAVAAAIGTPPAAVAFIAGGIIGLVPFALQLDRISSTVDETLGSSARLADRLAGAVVNVTYAMVVAWFVGAVASIVPGESSALNAVRSSASLGALVETVPPQGSLGVLVLRSGLVPGLNGPLVLAEPPDPLSATTPAVLAARSSVLQVRGTACGRIVTGTAWVAAPGLLLTNAHVVSGHQQTYLAGGPRFDGLKATVTAYDPLNDIAVLVPERDLQLPPLPLATTVRHGQAAAVVGFPRGGEQSVVPARIDRVAPYELQPLHGGTLQEARVLAFRADIAPGNSGGPIVSEDGHALGMVVAEAVGQRVDAAYGVASEQLRPLLAAGSRREPVQTGPCLSEKDLRS